MKNSRYVLIVLMMLTLLRLSTEAQIRTADWKGKRVAIAVFAQNGPAKSLEKSAQSRLESILPDNGMEVLDEKKASEMKNVWKRLEDPNYVLTAEEILATGSKDEIQGLVRVYLSADVQRGLADYFTATASADVRLVDANARVNAQTSELMGMPRCPPSDGLTENSALLNAAHRALDSACARVGLQVADPVRARTVSVKLSGPVSSPAEVGAPHAKENDLSLAKLATLENKTWRKESVTCTAKSPGGGLVAVAGCITDIDMHRRPPRMDGSRIHLVDTEGRRLNTFWCYEVVKKETYEKGTRSVLDCMFIANWRYLVAVTGCDLFFWDTELGVQLARLPFDRGLTKAALGFTAGSNSSYILVHIDRGQPLAYRLERAQDTR